MQVYPIFASVALVASQFVVSVQAQSPTRTTLENYVPCLFDRDTDASLRVQRTPRRLIQQTLDEWVLYGYLNARYATTLASTLSNHTPNEFAGVLDQTQAAGVLNLPSGITTLLLADSLASTVSAISQNQPPDVACSQGLLSWSEANDAFSRRIADTYLVYQINVRNLNSQKEFLMQDVQVAVDNHQFVAGRDKTIARGVALQGQVYGPWSTTQRVLEAAATVGLALTGVLPGIAVRDGINIFSASVVPAFASLAPDRSSDQMTRLNDASFSASQTYKIVVPKSGSVTLVTYIPFRIFASGKTAKHWSQAQWSALSDSSYVIISGVHVTSD